MECFDGLASLLIGENPLEAGTPLVQDVPGQHLLRPPRRSDSGDFRHRYRALGHHGQVLRQPVHVLLGGSWRDKVRAYASTLFRPTPEAMREAARSYLDRGLHGHQIRLGRLRRRSEPDVELVEAARTEIGDHNDLLIDTGWFVERTPKQAIQVIRSLEPYRPFFIEEILHPEDYDGYRQVAEAVDTLIACGEQEATEWGFRELIERAKVDILQPDLTRCGGFTVARKIVHMAERANVLVIPHSWSSDLLTAASLHLNAFQRRAVFIEFNTSQGPLSRELVKEPLRMEDGYLAVPTAPGLGVEVNEQVIDKYRIA